MVRPFLALLLPLALTAARPTSPRPTPRVLRAVLVLPIPIPDSIDATDTLAVDHWIMPRAHVVTMLLRNLGAPVDSGRVVYVPAPAESTVALPTRRSTE